MKNFSKRVLSYFYLFQHFSLTGDALVSTDVSCWVSCIVPTFDRVQDLEVLFHCLAGQDFPREFFEVLAIEDGATPETADCCARFETVLNIRYMTSTSQAHFVGSLRNMALCASRGKYILFLDDDTRILQRNFLTSLAARFESLAAVDCIQISAKADRALLPQKYDYLDRFSFATRCVAYRREAISLLGGFINSLKSYEDIELSIRFILAGGSCHQDEELEYYHPPLFIHSFNKAITNGLSFLTVRSRYSILVWIACYLNALRFLPLLCSPLARHRQWGKISAGFLVAPFYAIFGNRQIFYR